MPALSLGPSRGGAVTPAQTERKWKHPQIVSSPTALTSGSQTLCTLESPERPVNNLLALISRVSDSAGPGRA